MFGWDAELILNRCPMKQRNKFRFVCLNLMSFLILLVGLGSAALIYQRSDNEPNTVLGYEEGYDGSVYPILPENSKQYQRNMELYGGKANVLMDEFNRWFVGLWHGKSLAFIVAFVTIGASLAVFYAADHLPSHPKSDVLNENNGSGTN